MVIYIILFMTILVNKKSKNAMYLIKLIWGVNMIILKKII